MSVTSLRTTGTSRHTLPKADEPTPQTNTVTCRSAEIQKRRGSGWSRGINAIVGVIVRTFLWEMVTQYVLFVSFVSAASVDHIFHIFVADSYGSSGSNYGSQMVEEENENLTNVLEGKVQALKSAS